MRTTTTTHATILDLLRLHADKRPGQRAFTFLGNGEDEQAQLSFQALTEAATAVAATLTEAGLKGRCVVLMYPSGLDFVTAFLGCLMAGVIAVPVAVPTTTEGLAVPQKICEVSQAAAVFTDQATWTRLAHSTGWTQTMRPRVLDVLDDHAHWAWRHPATPWRPDLDDVAFLQFTSGSTGSPKGVAVSHGNIMSNQHSIQASFQHGDDTVVASWLPHHHDMGLVGSIMQPIYLGRPCVLMPPSAFLQKPIRWLKAISRYKVTTSGGPNFGYQLCLDRITDAHLQAHPDLDLAAWRVAFAGAEPLRAATLRGFASRFKANGFDERTLFPCYGMAESTLMVTAVERPRPLRTVMLDAHTLQSGAARDPVTDRGPEQAVEMVSCGRPWGDDQILIVAPDSHEALGDNHVGEVWVHGPSVAQGYWREPDLTAQHFAASLKAPPGVNRAFLRTGDLGFLRDGDLYITGRLKDLLIVNGRNHAPQDIEATVCALHPAFRPQAALFSVHGASSLEGERVVLVQEIYPHRAGQLDREEATCAIHRAVTTRHGLHIDQIVFTTDRIPVTTSGKIRRSACRDALISKALKRL